MPGVPAWIWGAVGGLILGPIGLVILWPACSQGALPLLKRFVISLLVKLILAGIGLGLALKFGKLPATPLALGFFVGYLVSLLLEITVCLKKVRKCAQPTTSS